MVAKSSGRWVRLSLVALAACAGGSAAVQRPPPEPEARGGEGIAIRLDGTEAESIPSAGETPIVERGGEATPGAGGEPDPAEPAAAEETDPNVRLLDAGRGPRRVLRYHPASGAAQTRAADVEIDLSIDMGGAAQTIPTLKLRVTGDSRIDAVGGTGDVEFTSEIVDVQTVSGPPDTAAYAQQFKGTTTARTISNRGVILKTDATNPQLGGADAERLMDRLTGMSGAPPALPAESIGVGARWEEQGRLDIQGLVLEIATTSELTAFDGNRATIRFSSSMSVDTRALNQGGMSWKDIVVSETGEYQVNLGKLVPETMTRELHVEASMAAGGSEAGMKLVMRMDARAN